VFVLYDIALVIFRRDLRAEDHTALLRAAASSKFVLPCFIVDERQLGNENAYRSVFGQQFLVESLLELQNDIRARGGTLLVCNGKPEEIVEKLLKEVPIDAVFVNRDYTPFSTKRDNAIAEVCKNYGRAFVSCSDALLHEPEESTKDDGKPYTMFTPFWRKTRTFPVATPEALSAISFFHKPVACAWNKDLQSLFPDLPGTPAVAGGRTAGLHILKKIRDFREYEHTRDTLRLSTTHLSAHLKFGTVSIREAFHAIVLSLGHSHPLLRQLYWRDFFSHIAWHFPRVFGHAFQKQYDGISWNANPKALQLFMESCTGFPIIDAAMRELTQTGFMHNRARMIVASFFVKDLHRDWREGERIFARYLVDYDPCVNNGNWQWAASTGCDAQPYFRIFNPWLQQEKFDPDAAYIKQWMPELRDIEAKALHKWYAKQDGFTKYPAPMLDHATESAAAKMMFTSVR
jgi:deoxyribodipyrimidine photo-lyase